MRVDRLSASYPHCLPGAACLGLALANGLRLALPVAVLGVAAAASSAAIGRSRELQLGALLALVLLGGWWWGSLRLDALDASVLTRYVDRADRMRLIVTGPARPGPFEIRVPAQAERFGVVRVAEPVLLQVPVGRSPPQGAIISLIGQIALPRGPVNGFDERTWLRRQGVQVVVRGDQWRIVGHRGGLGGVSDRLRSWLLGSSTPGLAGQRRAVIAGIVLGADEGLSDGVRSDFRVSGLYHLLAVSGQNVAFLAGGVLLLAWLLGVPRFFAEAAVLIVIAAYTLAVGWQPSVVRAAVAGSLASLAWLAARPRDRWYFLLLGAVVLLAWNPYSVLEPGFELSFAAVAAIFVLVPPLRRRLEGYPLPRALVLPIAVSTACGAATAPVLLLQFGKLPLYSVLANALAEPVVAALLGFGIVAAVLHPVLPGAAVGVAWANGWCSAYLLTCAHLVARLPYAQVSSAKVGVELALLCGLAWLGRRVMH